ncbi:MAG: pyridoxamine 5'-phosphate oxidase family protein [Myxococcota bacterium]
MAHRYLSELITPDVRAAQVERHGRSIELLPAAEPELLTAAEVEFIGRRDSFYLASISSSGWPYLQHRGGPPGFLKVLDPGTLAFADLRGNRQLITAGNLRGDDRVSLLLMDYPHRERLKILGHARAIEGDAALARRVIPEGLERKVERIIRIEVAAYDWNCPAHITPRFTEAEVREALAGGWRP